MRLLAILLNALLLVAVIAQGVHIVKTRRQVEALETRLVEVAAEQDLVREYSRVLAARPGDPEASTDLASTAAVVNRALPPPRFLSPPPPPSAGNQAALPPELDNPGTRAQLREFVAAEIVRDRAEQFESRVKERADRDKGRIQSGLETLQKSMHLTVDESRRLGEIMESHRSRSAELRARTHNGELPEDVIRAEFQSLRREREEQVRQLLGDARAQEAQKIARRK
jgi:hypothetical protein